MSEHNEPWSVSKGGWMVDTNLNAATIPKHYRRIVACVNACSGIPTHGLEGMSVALTLSEMADVQQQRDELAKAMQIIATTPGSAAHHRIAHQALAGINVTPNAELTARPKAVAG